MTPVLVTTLLLVTAITITTGEPRLDGYTLGSVTFQGGSVKSEGNDLEWSYNRSGREMEKLQLVGRSEWKVYLFNESNDYDMVIDYQQMKVLISDKEQHAIISGAFAIINGRNVGGVLYDYGHFVEIGKGNWQWTNRMNDKKIKLRETHRDAWSVYLRSLDGVMTFMLDYWRKSISFWANGGEEYDSFPIIRAKYSEVDYRVRS